MAESTSKLRMAENEVVFRQYNERVQKWFDEIEKHGKEDGQEHLLPKPKDEPLLFICECSDENCTQRIAIKPSRYNKLHKARNHFVLICGHETQSIEKVIAKEADYCVVEKFVTPPSTASGLHVTDAENT